MITISRLINGILPKKNEICYKDYRYIVQFNNRFPDDKVYLKNEDYILIIDGIILNKKDILSIYKKESLGETLLLLYQEKGEQFFSCMKGSFVGGLFDVKLDKWIVFRDKLGGRPVYYDVTGSLHLSTDIQVLYEELKQKGQELHLDPKGIQMLFDFGNTFDGLTICKEVHMVHPGCYLVYENNKLKEKQFYQIRHQEENLKSEDEYLDMIDSSYKDAITRQFGKDDEYNYKIITCLSGGVDSRMMVWISHQLGWNKQLNITFSNSGWYDETTARKIAKDLGHEWLFKPLDDANFMYDVDYSSRITGGNLLFTGVIHGKSLSKLIDFEGAQLGSLHTGSQGEIFKGEAVFGGEINKKDNHYQKYLENLGVTPFLDYSDPEVCTI